MNIFIDTIDSEERYTEELYKDYLKEQNKQLQERIDKVNKLIDELILIGTYEYEVEEYLDKLKEILKD